MNKTIDLSDIDPNAKGSEKTIENRIRNWARINSPWAIHYNSGSCNGCDIELLTLITPRYDVERFGVKLQGSPVMRYFIRHGSHDPSIIRSPNSSI
jgi:NADH:ubiquinone oxidoreductase subunit B-like Fe-S oxidoreductase